MNKFCIIIPIWKESLDLVEQISLKQLYKICSFNHYHVYLVCPKGLNVTQYLDIYPELRVEEFDKSFFESTLSYSQLCLNYNFYNRFSYYEYMQIYQLDGYIFEDKFKELCNKGYDYIGGPVWHSHYVWPDTPCVGNGGISLRKIETMKYLTNLNGEFRNLYGDLFDNIPYGNEDLFICRVLYKVYDINIASVLDANTYSFDLDPDICIKVSDNKLPIFCHALYKNIHFWKHYIPELNNKDIIDLCEEKEKVFFEIHNQQYLKDYK